jgi:hypothetical protein
VKEEIKIVPFLFEVISDYLNKFIVSFTNFRNQSVNASKGTAFSWAVTFSLMSGDDMP